MTLPPSGDVTFLFTDIEGSTRLLGRFPAAYAAALLRHDALMRSAVSDYDGAVFETIGDAVYAAFSSPREAVGAALRAQLNLRAEDWGELGEMRVRMAVHGGAVERRGEHYFGPALYRCARLMSIGHGGQVLLSGVVSDAVRQMLPADAGLRPMGTHRLKDLADPEVVSQLTHPGLLSGFPPLRSLSPRAGKLPDEPTEFIGRDRERSAVSRLLSRGRLLTLTGAGGTGKTRLAIQVAGEEAGSFDDGVWFVSLSAIRDASLVPSAIAQALDVAERRGQTVLDSVEQFLAARETLLILDNLEQLTEAAPIIARILAAAPRLKVLATSRVPLHLSAEQQFAVPPLDVAPLSTPEARPDAVLLFIQRALAVKPDLTIDSDALDAIAQICRRVDGLPLAIELAAARSKVLGPRALLARLGERLSLLSASLSDRPARHQSMRAAIAWSYELLDDGDRGLFDRAGVFAGGFTFDGAARVCGRAKSDLTDALARLVDVSLVREEIQPDGEPRFQVLETIREYALERLEERGEADSARAVHAAHYLALGETAAEKMRGPDMNHWIARVRAEHDNFRAALEFFTSRGDADSALALCFDLGWFWITCGFIAEGLDRVTRALAIPAEATPLHRAKALLIGGQILLQHGDAARSRKWHQDALAMARRAGEPELVAILTHDLGNVALLEGDDGVARELCEESLEARRGFGHPIGVAYGLLSLIEIARYQGEYSHARALWDEGMSLGPDGELRLGYELNGGMLALEQGENERARQLLQVSLAGWRAVDARVYMATAITGIAGLAASEDAVTAARFLGGAEGLLEPLGAVLWPADRRTFARIRSFVGEKLGDRLEAALEIGREISAEDVVKAALAYGQAIEVSPRA